MTCVAGEVEDGDVFLMADSAASKGDEIYSLPVPKVFARGAYLIGVAGSYRVAQVLRLQAELPEPESGDDERFLVHEFAPAVRGALETAGAARRGRRVLGEQTTLLVGFRGRLWHVDPDLTILSEGTFAAIGSGRLRAYSALYALRAAGIGPAVRRLELALDATAAFTANVRPPWRLICAGLR